LCIFSSRLWFIFKWPKPAMAKVVGDDPLSVWWWSELLLKCSVVLLENSVPSFPGKRKQNPWNESLFWISWLALALEY
jgi:hypothetical protein